MPAPVTQGMQRGAAIASDSFEDVEKIARRRSRRQAVNGGAQRPQAPALLQPQIDRQIHRRKP